MKRLVTISREYASGGRTIGRLIAEKLGLPFYDNEIISMAAAKSGLSPDIIEKAELRARSSLSYSFASAMSYGEGFTTDPMSMNEKLFIAQFDVIRQIGERGEGVIVGRCADYVLRDIPGVTNVFIYAEMNERRRRAMERYGVDEKKVDSIIKDYDKARQNYYNYHTSQKWGHYTNYNIAINTSYISEENAANLIVDFMNSRIYKEPED